MIIKIYKGNRNHRQLQRLIEKPETICVNSGDDGKIIARIPIDKGCRTKNR